MRVAVTLTGQIEDRHTVAPYIKEMFNYISENYGITFDFYFHHWLNDNPYLYKINNEILKPIRFPTESEQNINFFIDTIKPVSVLKNNYADLKDLYIDYGIALLPDGAPNIHVTSEIVNFLDIVELYYNKEINEDVFLKLNNIRAGINFDNWWELHKHWFMFNHGVAQHFAVEQCFKSIRDSGIHYDAVVKWRSDALFDYYQNAEQFVNAIKNAIDNNTFTTSHAWEVGFIHDKEVKIEVSNEELYNTDISTTTFAIQDIWWIISKQTSDLMASCLTKTYCYIRQHEKKLKIKIGNHHTWLFYALQELKLRPYILTDGIYIILIRNPNLLSNDNFQLNHSRFSVLANDNLRQSKLNQLLAQDKINDITYKYAVAKHFNFLSHALPYES